MCVELEGSAGVMAGEISNIDLMPDQPIGGDERLLKTYEVAEMLGVSADTVLRYVQRGALPAFRLWGQHAGPLRFRRSEIEAAMETWRTSSA